MRKRTAILLTLLASAAITGRAQFINAYVTGGAITSQIEGDELKGFNRWWFTGGVGAFVRFDQEGTWSMSVEADYAGRGVYNNLHTSQNLYNIDMVLHYVDIPVTVFFKDPFGGLRIGLGPVYGRLVQQPHDTIQCRPSYFFPDTTDMAFLKNDMSLAGELRFTIWNNLQLSVRYQHSLFPVKKGWTFTEGEHKWQNDCYNQSVMFRLIWQFGEPERSNHKRSQAHKPHSGNKPKVTVRRRR